MEKTQIQKEAQRVLKQEAKALEDMANALNHRFVDAVELIFNSSGKVIISGVGKSELIGKKIAATLTSTGTPSVCIHATDALHGDIGIVNDGDVAILISRSGFTHEILTLVAALRLRNVSIIAITCFPDSPLAQKSDITLEAGGKIEACPFGLAPTTSTTSAMALGDALAVCLLGLRNFSHDDYAKVHPSGSLGRKLLLTAQDLIRRDVAIVKPESPMEQVILSISAGRSGAAVVVDSENKVLGIITDGDLRRLIAHNTDFRLIPASEVMNVNPKTSDPGIPASDALLILEESRISQLILVTPEQKLVGLIHLHDIIAEGIRT